MPIKAKYFDESLSGWIPVKIISFSVVSPYTTYAVCIAENDQLYILDVRYLLLEEKTYQKLGEAHNDD